MINARCFTNLDSHLRAVWPTMFLFAPRIGDYVQSEEHGRLRVVSLIHIEKRGVPEIEVELHR